MLDSTGTMYGLVRLAKLVDAYVLALFASLFLSLGQLGPQPVSAPTGTPLRIINTDSQISKRLTCHTTSDINRISDENLISDLERPSTVPSDQQPERNIDNQLLSQQNNLSLTLARENLLVSIINTDSQISKRLTCHTTSDINCISDENLISDLERPLTVPSDQQPERNIDNQLLSQQNNLSFQPDKNNSSSLIKRISLSLPNTNSVE
ncbi:hypothetical protein Pst134EB_001947 [Puccinia striiformis f. sp. tritici]|nr:hypothetical protein Pst134EB_001947 [Puccinia striiformis f. sp. tritici]